jgi:hypothetical protein
MVRCMDDFRMFTQYCRMFQNPRMGNEEFRMFQFLANRFRRRFRSEDKTGSKDG